MEEWKDIVEERFSNRYAVSNLGRVKRKEHFVGFLLNGKTETMRNYSERICSVYIGFHYNYYPTVLLYDSEKKKSVPRSIHSLVAKAFLKKEPHHQCVNHKDCNKENNNVENLEWTTIKENTKHAYDNGLIPMEKAWSAMRGKRSNRARPVYQYTKDGTFVRKFESLKEAADFYGGNYYSVSKACQGKVETYKKHIWSYELL
jgi:hypothetical protein